MLEFSQFMGSRQLSGKESACNAGDTGDMGLIHIFQSVVCGDPRGS